MVGRELTLEHITKLIKRFKNYKKGIPVSELGIKSWGIIDYAKKLNIPILLNWRE